MRLRFGEFELDDLAFELRRAGDPISLGSQALQLLIHLARHRDRVVSRAELHELLWQGTTVGETSLGQAVRQARRAIDDDGNVQRVVRNVRGRGYRFVAAELQSEDDSSPARRVPVDASPARTRDCFVGRESELAQLQTAFEAAASGRGQALWVAGEEGIGKTRLAEELARLALGRGALVLRGGCVDGDWSASYGPLAEVVASVAQRSDTAEVWRELAADHPTLQRLIGLSLAADTATGDSSAAREAERVRLFGAVEALLARLSELRPLVILLDDLHWADAATLALTHHIARHAATGGWLVIGLWRDRMPAGGPVDQLASLGRIGERRAPLCIGGLEPGALRSLLEHLADRPLPGDLASAIHRETGGNPFFAREILSHLLEEGELVDGEGAWREDFALTRHALPEGVRSVISRRLASLGPTSRELLTAASAARGPFRFEPVRSAAQLDEPAALDGLEEALDARILVETENAETYAFSHDLMRRVLYTEQSPARRVRLHRRLAEALVTHCGEAADDQAELIARQYHASGELAGAEAGVPFCLTAADRAAAVAAWEGEADFLGLALDLLSDDDPCRFSLLERHGLALAFSGAVAKARRVASQAASMLIEREGPGVAAAYLANLVGGVAWGATRLAWDLGDQAMQFVDADKRGTTWARLRLVELWHAESEGSGPVDSPERREATEAVLDNWQNVDRAQKNGLSLVGLAFESRQEVLDRAADTPVFLALWAGEYERALPLLRQDARLAESHAELAGAYFCLATVARLEAALGRLDLAREALAESEALRVGLPRNLHFDVTRASAHTELALATGNGFDELVKVFDDLGENVDPGSRWVMPIVLCVGAEVFALAGLPGRAQDMLDAAAPGLVQSPGWMTAYTLMVNSAAGAQWALGRDAWAQLVEAQLRSKTLRADFRFPATDARLSLARLCALQGRVDEALHWFERARGVLDEQGARPLRAITDLDEARVVGGMLERPASGKSMDTEHGVDRDRAARLLDLAHAGFESVGMTGWIARAESLGDELGM